MITNLSEILEKWAELYIHLSHDPKKGSKDKAYCEVTTINDQSYFMRNNNSIKSPCMAYSILIDAEGTSSSSVSYLHNIYFMSKAKMVSLAKNAKQDDELGATQQMLMDEMVQDLLTYLFELKRTGKCPITGRTFDQPTLFAIKGLDLVKAHWASIPIKYGEWHILGLSIEQLVPRSLCIIPEKYKTPGETAPAADAGDPATADPNNTSDPNTP